MSDVSGNTLMMAIQAVDHQLVLIGDAIEQAGDDANPDDHEMWLAYWKTALALKAAYEIELQTTSNLPPYEQLVRGPP